MRSVISAPSLLWPLKWMRPVSSTGCVPGLPRGLARVIVAVMLRRSCLLLVFVSGVCVGAEADPAQEARFLKNTRQLIYEGKRSGEGYFSADGKRIIFQSEREAGNPFYQIYT